MPDLRFAFLAVWLVVLASCSRSVIGIYYHESDPTERLQLMSNGKLLVQETGDVADYVVDGDIVQITHTLGGASGRLDGNKLVFTGNGVVADSVRGTWTRMKAAPRLNTSWNASDLLGKDLRDPEVQAVLVGVGDGPTRQSDAGTKFYSYRRNGFALKCQADGRILAVYVYPQDTDGFDCFQGIVPEGLSWSDSRAQVAKKLGEPSYSGVGVRGAGPHDNLLWDRYKNRNLTVWYRSQASDDKTATIAKITIEPLQ